MGQRVEIAQCFFKEEQKIKLFRGPVYKGFGLEPHLNPSLTTNCPELEDPKVRLALTEYACMLWYYRNPDSIPDFFGTTSYRQLEKIDFMFKSPPINIPESHILTWGYSKYYDCNGRPISCAMQAEIAHPNINSYIEYCFGGKEKVPKDWYSVNESILANYWLMSRDNFIDFMDFSWPLVKNALEDFNNKLHPYFTSKMLFGCDSNKAVGYFMERLFMLWCMSGRKNIEIYSVAPIKSLRSPVAIYV